MDEPLDSGDNATQNGAADNAAEAAWEKLTDAASSLGAERGASAGEWYAQDAFGGRVTRGAAESAARILRGIEEGDPVILDTLPAPDMSGEWADTASGPDVYGDIYDRADMARPDDADDFTDLLDVYETAYRDAAQDTISELARAAI